jgi:hypothetical protein
VKFLAKGIQHLVVALARIATKQARQSCINIRTSEAMNLDKLVPKIFEETAA